MMEEKTVILELSSVRVVRFDNMNLLVQKLTEKEVDGYVKQVYVNKGYVSNILEALKLISRKELLLAEFEGLEEYVEAVEKSNKMLLGLI